MRRQHRVDALKPDAIEQTQLPRQHRVDGVGRPKFDFHRFQFTRNNILGTHVLLEAAKVHDVVRFVHVSTDEVYGEGESMETAPMIEDHVLEPTNPYAATKAAAEFLVKSYHRSFGLPVIITRGTCCGVRQSILRVSGSGHRLPETCAGGCRGREAVSAGVAPRRRASVA